jgi:hypothetical protein
MSPASLVDRYTPANVRETLRGRIGRHWHRDVARHVAIAVTAAPDSIPQGPALAGEDAAPWPYLLPFGTPSSKQLESSWERLQPAVLDLRRWANQEQLRLIDDPRRVFGAIQHIPIHVEIPDLKTAARIAADSWPATIATAFERAPALALRLAETNQESTAERMAAMLAGLLRKTVGWSALDFAILLDVADWFRRDPDVARGLSPRQVPIPGVHGKWLEKRKQQVRDLAGLPDLGLADGHPPRIHFTYLDPSYREDPQRRVHDSACVGDAVPLPYRARIVIISENKDTAVNFPLIDNAVSVEGVGRGGRTIASFDWITDAEIIIYWGDMDADGLEILDGFREAGLAAQSILMDRWAWARYRTLGTHHYADGRKITARDPKTTPHLSPSERDLYLDLCSTDWSDYRRLEQERIPLAIALVEVRNLALTQFGTCQAGEG